MIYIDRFEVYNAINDAVESNALSYEGCVNQIMVSVAKIPAADVAPVRHGRWADNREHEGGWFCTACGEEVTICSVGKDKTWEYPYCPNCGAKMDGGADDAVD